MPIIFFSLDGPSPHSMTSFLKETCRKSHDFLLHFCQKCSGLFRWFPSMGTKFFLQSWILFSYQMHPLSMKILYSSKKSEKFKLLKVFILYKLGQKVCNFGSPKIVWIILSPWSEYKIFVYCSNYSHVHLYPKEICNKAFRFSFRQYKRYSLKCISVNRKSTNIFI